MNIPRHLVTTADERAWKFDRPVLFLGEWCRLYSRKRLWTVMDAIVAKPYGLEEKIKNRDYLHTVELFNVLLVELSERLNAHHKTKHGLRYWRILLGHWLNRYVSVILNRWNTLEQVVQDYEISGTTILNEPVYCLTTLDSSSFIWACNDDLWNHVLYSKLLKYTDLKIESDHLGDIAGFRIKSTKTLSRSLSQRLKCFVINAAAKLCRGTDAFIINSFLPKTEEAWLQLSLGQMVQLWQSPPPICAEPNMALRQSLGLNPSVALGVNQVARILLMEVLPTCYLEGYQALTQQMEKLPWPEKPKFIFTSNNFDTDEIFKLWAASKVEQGVPYYIGQHGNHYGTQKYCTGEVECVAISDKFITWGWADQNPKYVPAFIFKLAGKVAPVFDREGGLLLIEVCLPHRINVHDQYPRFSVYQEEQFRFVESLPSSVVQQLTVRLHAEYKQHHWDEEQRWNDRVPNARIEKGSTPIETLISGSRLVVHSYDSTGILETLALNIPTLCFWHGGLSELRDSAVPYYERLRQAGILQDTPEAAAAKVAKVWDDVPAWWNSVDVQAAREEFCHRYAHTSAQPTKELQRLLTHH